MGGAGDNRLTGGSNDGRHQRQRDGDDTINGGNGDDDTIDGGNGDDIIVGGAGADTDGRRRSVTTIPCLMQVHQEGTTTETTDVIDANPRTGVTVTLNSDGTLVPLSNTRHPCRWEIPTVDRFRKPHRQQLPQ